VREIFDKYGSKHISKRITIDIIDSLELLPDLKLRMVVIHSLRTYIKLLMFFFMLASDWLLSKPKGIIYTLLNYLI